MKDKDHKDDKDSGTSCTDKTPRHALAKCFTVTCSLDRNGEGRKPIWYTGGSETIDGRLMALRELYMEMLRGGSFASASGNTPRYARQKCVPPRHTQLRLEAGGTKNKNIYIPPGSQAEIKAVGNYQIHSKFACDCHQSLVKLTEHDIAQYAWAPSHRDIGGNEIADQLTTICLKHPFI
jgi:hypothetical protein